MSGLVFLDKAFWKIVIPSGYNPSEACGYGNDSILSSHPNSHSDRHDIVPRNSGHHSRNKEPYTVIYTLSSVQFEHRYEWEHVEENFFH